ncbi:MAG: sigma 54-interacting transcriptional regulator [Candidatus Wallbacteria bacterium]|nr:sigma 54-interacting transcriptional regulator [Candidatus Wallbacteria bacterium]
MAQRPFRSSDGPGRATATTVAREGATERLGSSVPAGVSCRRCRLEVLEGPDAGRSELLDTATVRIGSGVDCEMSLPDASVSRSHAVLVLSKEGYLVRDAGSTNGTTVDGVRVKEAYLAAGSVLGVGRTRLRFDPADEEIEAPPSSADRFHGMLGRSAAMRQLFGLLERVAPTRASVLLTGETGTGKELAARALHAASTRAAAPCVVFDCANTDRELVRSELFGHEPGAFTGATAQRLGVFERARAGTVFLDEIGELPQELQPRLLRVLDRREVTRLGGSQVHAIDVRVVAATHRDLLAMVAEGTFREDLYYRIAQIVLRLPSLVERIDDIPVLATTFLSDTAPGRSFSFRALGKLACQSWPGNVRELKNRVEAAAALSRTREIGPEEIPSEPARAAARPVAPGPRSQETAAAPAGTARSLAEAERDTIARALSDHSGNISHTAKALGISRLTLRRKIAKLGLAARSLEQP